MTFCATAHAVWEFLHYTMVAMGILATVSLLAKLVLAAMKGWDLE